MKEQKKRSYLTFEAEKNCKQSFVLISTGSYTIDRTRPDVPYSLIGRKSGSVWECTIIFEKLDEEDILLVGVDVEECKWKSVDLVPGLPDDIISRFDPTYKPDLNVVKQAESARKNG